MYLVTYLQEEPLTEAAEEEEVQIIIIIIIITYRVDVRVRNMLLYSRRDIVMNLWQETDVVVL